MNSSQSLANFASETVEGRDCSMAVTRFVPSPPRAPGTARSWLRHTRLAATIRIEECLKVLPQSPSGRVSDPVPRFIKCGAAQGEYTPPVSLASSGLRAPGQG